MKLGLSGSNVAPWNDAKIQSTAKAIKTALVRTCPLRPRLGPVKAPSTPDSPDQLVRLVVPAAHDTLNVADYVNSGSDEFLNTSA